jgi:hypothetical protein
LFKIGSSPQSRKERKGIFLFGGERPSNKKSLPSKTNILSSAKAVYAVNPRLKQSDILPKTPIGIGLQKSKLANLRNLVILFGNPR